MTTSPAGIVARLGRESRSELAAFSFSGPTAGLAFRASLAGVLAIVVAIAFHLDDPYWAGITAFGMLQHDAAATLSRSFDRVVGTVAGAALGYVLSATVADHVIFSALAGSVVGFTLYAQARVDHSYAVLLLGVTALLVMFGSLFTPGVALTIAVYRALEIVVGAVAASVVDILLGPDPASQPKGPPKPGVFSKPVDVDLLVIAITAGLAIASVPGIWNGLELPGLDQTPITAFVIMIAIQRDPHWTAATRATGCIAGGIYGLLCLGVIDDSFVLWISLLFLGLYLSGHVLHRGGAASYVGHQAGVAVILAMVEGMAPSPDILPAIDRLVGIFGGIILVALFQVLFSPLVRRCVVAMIR
ncbi:MAG TPA: FUSC family protein [Acetobacteraceae bacterium]|nr:FUSC family protein [Acetobacteraceae bacterium]